MHKQKKAPVGRNAASTFSVFFLFGSLLQMRRSQMGYFGWLSSAFSYALSSAGGLGGGSGTPSAPSLCCCLTSSAARCASSISMRCFKMKRLRPCSATKLTMVVIEPATKMTPSVAKNMLKMRRLCGSVGMSP